MDWIQILVIIFVVVSFFYWLHKDMTCWMKHVMTLQAEQSKRMDSLYEHIADLIRTRKL